MKNLFFALLLVFSSVNSFAQNAVSPFYKHFKGEIANKYELVMDLNYDGTRVFGSYYYVKHKTLIRLEGTIKPNGQVQLSEYTATNKTGTFVGKITASNFTGTWYNNAKTKPLNVALKEDYSNSIEFLSHHLNAKMKKDESEIQLSITYLNPKRVADRPIARRIQNDFNKYIFQKPNPTGSTIPDQLERYKTQFFGQSVDSDMEESNVMSVIYNNDGLLSMSVDSYDYAGGAHGVGNSFYKVYDIKKNRTLTINDLIDKTKINRLNQILNRKLRERKKIPQNESLSSHDFLVENITFNNNFYVNCSGITFVYNVYEIAPYYLGATEVHVPFSALKGILNTQGSLQKLLN